VNDPTVYVGREAADAAAERIRAYLARFPNMASVGPETAFDIRDAEGNPYALPVTDLQTVLDRLQEAEVGRERFEGEASELRFSLNEHRKFHGPSRKQWTLRDLLRLAHRRGLYLSRARNEYDTERHTYQVWEPAAEFDPDRPWATGRRWVEVRYWPRRRQTRDGRFGPTWFVRLNGTEQPNETTSRMAHAELWDPTIPEIVGALEWLGLLGEPSAPVPDLRNHLELP
jgi:hypothetical protein